MRRISMIGAAVALLLTLFAPAALAAGPYPDHGQVLMSFNNPVDVPAGEHLDALVVVGADARVSGDVRSIVIAGGTATLSGATTQSLVVVGGTADLQSGTTVSGDVRTVGGSVTQQPGSTIGGSVTSLDADLAALGFLLFPFFILLFLGIGLAAVGVALLVAAFGSRQVRAVESVIDREPLLALVTGIVANVLLPLVAVLLMVSVIGAPIGFALLFVLWPAVAILGWIVAAIWVGDWVVERWRGEPDAGRPYRAAIVGVVVLAIAGLFPFVSAIATLFGLGALLLTAGRMLRGGPRPIGDAGSTLPAPSIG